MATNSTVQAKVHDAVQDVIKVIQYQADTARQLAQDTALLTQSQTTLPPNQLAALRALVTAAQDHDREALQVIDGMQALVGALRARAPDNVIQDLTGRITESILRRTHAKETYDIAKRSTPGAASTPTSTPVSTPVSGAGPVSTPASGAGPASTPASGAGPAGLPKENCSWNDIKEEFFRSERVINANIGRISNNLDGLFDIGQHLYTTLSEIKKSGTILNIDECTKIIQLVKDYIQNLEEEVDRLGGKHDEVEEFVRELDLVTRGIVDHSIGSGGVYTSQIQAGSAAPQGAQAAQGAPPRILNRFRKLFTSTPLSPLSPPPQDSPPADFALFQLRQLTQTTDKSYTYPNIITINSLIGYFRKFINDPRFDPRTRVNTEYRDFLFKDKSVQRAIAYVFRQALITKKFPVRKGQPPITVMPRNLNVYSAKGDFLSGLDFKPFDQLTEKEKNNLSILLYTIAPFPQAGGRITKAKRSRSKKRSRTRRY